MFCQLRHCLALVSLVALSTFAHAAMMTSSTSKNPVPSAQSLTPSNATHGSGNLLITLKGTGFFPGSQVTWNGTSLYAAYVSSTQLNVYVPAGDLASAGSATVVVTNPAPGGWHLNCPGIHHQLTKKLRPTSPDLWEKWGIL